MIYTKKKDDVNGTWCMHAYSQEDIVPKNASRLSESEYESLTKGTHCFDKNGKVIPYEQPITEANVRMEASARIKVVGRIYTQQEQQTWPEQVQEAVEYLADPQNTVTPFLGARASARKITVEQMANKVLEKRNQHKQAVGAILAAQDKLLAMNPIPKNYRDDKYWK